MSARKRKWSTTIATLKPVTDNTETNSGPAASFDEAINKLARDLDRAAKSQEAAVSASFDTFEDVRDLFRFYADELECSLSELLEYSHTPAKDLPDGVKIRVNKFLARFQSEVKKSMSPSVKAATRSRNNSKRATILRVAPIAYLFVEAGDDAPIVFCRDAAKGANNAALFRWQEKDEPKPNVGLSFAFCRKRALDILFPDDESDKSRARDGSPSFTGKVDAASSASTCLIAFAVSACRLVRIVESPDMLKDDDKANLVMGLRALDEWVDAQTKARLYQWDDAEHADRSA